MRETRIEGRNSPAGATVEVRGSALTKGRKYICRVEVVDDGRMTSGPLPTIEATPVAGHRSGGREGVQERPRGDMLWLGEGEGSEGDRGAKVSI
jgi:hypothetical protein